MPHAFRQYRPHPWHGISPGPALPTLVTAYIEITPIDGIKYEIDKETGYLKVDRPQLTSSLPPALYGFIPQTYCHARVGNISGKKLKGDGDPLDICVFSERTIGRSDVLVPARVIGGFRMVDKGEADDKIIAVLENDPYCSKILDIENLHPMILQRLQHYFLTYKLVPNQAPAVVIDETYGLEAAQKVILASREDYKEHFGSMNS